MKTHGFAACILFAFLLVAPASAQSDPCDKQEYSNAEMRNCYSKGKSKVNAQIDSLVAKITADFRRDAKQDESNGDDVVAQCELRAASKVERSQASWNKYREEHCGAILDSYTTGSGAGTAYEECEFRLGRQRLKELRTSFLTWKVRMLGEKISISLIDLVNWRMKKRTVAQTPAINSEPCPTVFGVHSDRVISSNAGRCRKMKTAATWLGALILGFIGGIAGQRFGNWQTMSTELTFSTKAHTFELLDRSGRVVSQWTTDQWGRPVLQFSDAKWEGRIVIGPIEQADVATNEPPDSNAAWGISVTAPGHVAHAALGTTVDATTKKPIGFGNWR